MLKTCFRLKRIYVKLFTICIVILVIYMYLKYRITTDTKFNQIEKLVKIQDNIYETELQNWESKIIPG